MLTTNQIKDILERAISTYIQVFAGLLAGANLGIDALSDLSTVKTLAVAALPAAISVVKSAVVAVAPFGDESASALRVGYEVIREVPVKPVRKKAQPKTAPAKKSEAK
jgi:uncharacterized membrane protein YccF (DUF307 family)